ncbi:chemotaxis protein [Helicobacter sp. MIT 05-5294]|uniref:chemotaxis protein n=1 Tax=Helicobacter sp. MIT 05-5294 TaxID=1548150 RepID=UPI00051FBFED|nr:chemotaxis protein [Helicobacter sp. MIT 05-5294]TLD89122.1 chemotaxis protein [Helicobacter sp. MIT 05-5294]
MTQEELDSLLGSDMDDVAQGQEQENTEESASEDLGEDSIAQADPTIKSEAKAHDFSIEQDVSWPPPPPTAEHKVVHQLDDVTRDSEIKATEMFDKLEKINNLDADIEDAFGEIQQFIDSQEELLQKLHAKFPDFHTFNEQLEAAAKVKSNVQKVSDSLQEIANISLDAMEAMQYQDIHRQKIERVINIMRALARYMSSLFEGKIDDNKRVSSAVHIQGDKTENVVNESDIEALIANFGK